MKQLLLLFSFLCLGCMSLNAQSGSRTIKGYVTDVTYNRYKGMAGVKVTINTIISNVETGEEEVCAVTETYTDENGYYSLTVPTAIPDFKYYSIKCETEGYYTHSKSFIYAYNDWVHLFMLEELGFYSLHGHVIDHFTKQPISGAEIIFNGYSSFPEFEKRIITDNEGLWTVQVPLGLDNDCEVNAMGYIERYMGDMDSEKDTYIDLCPDRLLVHLNGKMIDKNTKKPIVGIELSLGIYDDYDMLFYHLTNVSTTTDSEGNYSCDFSAWVGTGLTAPSDVAEYCMVWRDKTSIFGESFRLLGEGLCFDPYYGDFSGFGQVVIENGKPVIYHTLNIEVDEKAVSDDAGLVDGINVFNADANAAKHYSVSGVEVAPNAKGLHIVNGKKVFIK